MKITIKVLQPSDVEEFVALLKVFEEVFEMENLTLPSKDYLSKLLAKEDFKAVVAVQEGQVFGGLTLYFLAQYYSTQPLAYLYDLAVLTEFQRQGIGRQLIAFVVAYCKKAGFEEVFVQADKVDDYALDFYRTTQPTAEEEVAHFYYRLV